MKFYGRLRQSSWSKILRGARGKISFSVFIKFPLANLCRCICLGSENLREREKRERAEIFDLSSSSLDMFGNVST